MATFNHEKIEMPDNEDELEEVYDELAERVMGCFRQAKSYRSSLQIQGKTVDDWIRRLNDAYHKIHDGEELASRKNMRSYFGLIQIKINMVASYMRSKYASPTNPPFNITPTPIVELPENKKDQGLERVKAALLNRMIESGLPPEALLGDDGFLLPKIAKFIEDQSKEAKALLRQEELQIASDATAKMMTLIKDQLVENNFSQTLSESLFDIALMPVMVIGYDNQAVVDYQWQKNKYVKKTVIRPTFRRINPINAFFAPDATNAQDGSFFIELTKRTKAQLSSFLGKEELGYNDEALRCVINTGDAKWLGFDTDNKGVLDYMLVDDEIHTLRCQMLIQGKDLIDYGVSSIKESDADDYFNADIEVCDGRVIRCQIVAHPKGERTYFSASYKRIAGEPYGISVGMMIYDRQQSINRTQYSMLLNAVYAAGPMIEVDADKFSDPSQITFEPFSRVNSNPTKENNARGITQHSIPLTFPQLFNFMTNEIRLGDDECGLPSFLNGNAGLQGAGQTLGGLAMMTDNAVLGLEDCAFNIDEYFISPAITLMYAHNLLGDDDSVKADAKITPTGLLGLKTELNKAKELAGLVPQASQFAQQGLVPQQMISDMVRDYFKSAGIDTDRYMLSNGVQSDLNNAQMASQTSGLDGRSLRMM
ncbi:hypothetical protein [Rodentibacter pneumotropicus]|uniref:hypothetical protein n=1 Tax=Rodentibacter pneumotropicus TaxID=758 RepID=UPI00098707C2|nr:hypothetical protein [Rodentibacter pneumotropicus]OOF62050.1 hypothetical protein BKL50_06640 [Rodentibacter pneumotropicus]THA18289.1 hypothetical protein D3M83_06075 [Rodentibacter pneumotropicus]